MIVAWRALFILGTLTAIFGLGVDVLLPGASPGLNLPQLLIIVLGFALALFALALRRSSDSRRPPASARSTLLKVLALTLATLLALELALSLWGLPTYYLRQVPPINAKELPWGLCDELGCRKRYEAVVDACAAGILAGVRCVINRDGFGDTDEFVVAPDFPQRARVLMLGDSYTRGFFADVGLSFVDALEAALPEAVVWNVAEPGTATNQAVLSFAGIAPRLQPQLAILGFYMNDFPENLLPKEMGLRLIDDSGKQYFVKRFDADRWGNPVELPADAVNAYLAAGARPPTSELERLVGLTRLGTLGLRTLDIALGWQVDESFERQVEATRQYLAQLRDAAAALDSLLLVLLIPQPEDVGAPGEAYRTGVGLLKELGIPYLEARHLLDARADYIERHWNNAGHQKVGAFLSDCVAAIAREWRLADCEAVTLP